MKRTSDKRWRYAQAQEIAYQRSKIARFGEQTQALSELARAKTWEALRRLDALGLGQEPDPVVLEIGSGAHGLIWHWPAGLAIGLDPLAHFYRGSLDFQRCSRTSSVQARGEQIPLAPATVDLVVTENVLDHSQDPVAIIDEIHRVLKPGGLFYCVVDVHHWFWGLGARVYNGLFAAGLRLRVPAYPHHPFHFRRAEFKSLVGKDRFDLLYESCGEAGGVNAAARPRWRNAIMRRLPKNVDLTIVAAAR